MCNSCIVSVGSLLIASMNAISSCQHIMTYLQQQYCTGPLPPEITHIILDSKNLTIKQLKKKLNCDDISPDVRIVHNNWLIESVAKSSRLDESEYIIEINEQDTDMQMKSGRDVNSSADGEANSSSNKKQKISSTDSGTSVGQVTVEKYPIIPNPISFPDFTPIYGSWQEYRSVMYKFNDPAKSVSSDQPTGGTEGSLALHSIRKVFIVAMFASIAQCLVSTSLIFIIDCYLPLILLFYSVCRIERLYSI